MHLSEDKRNKRLTGSRRSIKEEENSFHMMREVDEYDCHAKDPMDLSLPVEINDENEYDSSNS